MQPKRAPLSTDTAAGQSRDGIVGGGLDRGFGHMLEQAAISPELEAELAAGQTTDTLSALEQSLLARWPVAQYASVLRDPVQALERHQDDYQCFLDEAQAVLDELGQSDYAAMMVLRFPVGGVQLDWSRFELSDLFLGQLWLAEMPMLEWIGQHRQPLEALCAKARPYALAQSALLLEQTSGQTRLSSARAGRLYAYLDQLYATAFNLVGVNPLHRPQLASAGISPLLIAGGATQLASCDGTTDQIFRVMDIDVGHATAAQLRSVGCLMLENRMLDAQQYSLLSHAQWLLSVAHAPAGVMAPDSVQDWIEVFSQCLSDLWLRGDRGDGVQSALELLKPVS